jgi:hypothetical protein
VSVAFQLTLVSDGITPVLQRALAAAEPRQLATWAGTSAKRLTQDHLRSLGRNKRGWPTTRFWSRAARATSFAVLGSAAEISINQIGVRQRYYGGVIRARQRRMLTIPIGPEAYGKTASDFPEAFLLKTKKGAYLVQRGLAPSAKTGKLIKRTGQGFAAKRVSATFEFLFKLVASVNQAPNPEVLPNPADLSARVAADVQRNLLARIQ